MREIEELSALMTDLARIRKVFFFYINGYLEYKRENPESIGHCDCNLKDNVDIVLSTGSVYFKRTVANLFE